ncbi:MAG: tRNA (adenosine(37)-N6)-dimethylallyltransferase MiaA, partial [Dehalococcoidia bacterium]
KGYGFDLPSMSGIGYRQVGMYLRGEMELKAAIEQIKFGSHRFARHQYAWFSLRDARIHWFHTAQCSPEEVSHLITSKIGSP